MKLLNLFLVSLLAIATLNSCNDKNDADHDGNLEGRWNVTKVEGRQFVNGVEDVNLTDNSPSGFIEFNGNGTGEQNYTFNLFGSSFPNISNFRWTSTASKIFVERIAQSDLEWDRIENTPSKQVAAYDITIDASTRVRYILTLEK